MMTRPLIAFYSLDLTNTFNETLYQGVLDGVEEAGFELAVIHGGQLKGPHSFEHGRNFLYRIVDPQDFSGLILPNIFSFIPEEEQQDLLKGLSVRPMVTIGHQVPGVPGILVDNTKGYAQLIGHLVHDLGLRKIGVITGPRYHHDSIERLKVYRDTLRAFGMEPDPQREVEGTWGLSSGVLCAKELLRRWGRDLEVIVCFNDTMAIGALQELTRQGFRCPRDILITGFDNTYESRNSNPPLSTVAVPVYQMGRLAATTLCNLIQGGPVSPVQILDSRVLFRRSTRDEESHPSLLHEPSPLAMIPGGALETLLVQEFLAQARGLWSSQDQADLRIRIRDLTTQFLLVLERDSLEGLLQYCRDFFHRWLEEGRDLTPWATLLEKIPRALPQKSSPENRALLVQALTEARLVLQEAESIELTHQRIQERIFTSRILDLGEELSAAFGEEDILQALQRFFPDIGIQKCLLVRMDTRKTPLEGRVLLQWGGGSEDQTGSTIHPPQILPPDFRRYLGHYLVEPLQIRDEFFGYMVVNLPFHPGLAIKNLRYQISTALEISELMGEIQAHTHTLEDQVSKRTSELKKANEKLKQEIAERQKVETELIRTRNLESLGLLAGGIAHDFNNLLTAVLGNASLMEMGSLDQGEMDHCVRDIINASLQARELTQQLLTFSRGGSPVKTRTKLDQLVEETARFVLRGQGVRGNFYLPSDLWDVEADKGQLSQVLNNIILNAVQAMGGAGSIWFTAENLSQDSPQGSLPPGDYVRLSIRDEGPGIPREFLDRIFDPYFTTKKEGTGLGLATSLGIIRKHGGTIQVTTEDRQGTTFTIVLPRSHQSPAPTEGAAPLPLPTRLNVLLLEDQDQVRTVMQKLVESLGHRIAVTVDGKDTVELFHHRRRDDPFDLVILDLIIPGGMGGVETLKALRSLDPQVYAIASSGYSEQGGIGNFRSLGFNDLLPKPFQKGDVQKVLDTFLFRTRG